MPKTFHCVFCGESNDLTKIEADNSVFELKEEKSSTNHTIDTISG